MRKRQIKYIFGSWKRDLVNQKPPGLPECVLVLEIELYERNLSVEEKDFVKCAIQLLALMTGEEFSEETGNNEKSLLQERLLKKR